MPKNIVILSDGTGQVGGKGHDSNVYKLFRMLADRTDEQIVFYDQGLGTDRLRVTGNAFGAGFSKNLLQCYKFIFDNYKSGDKIFLFGFSRGAATVRSLASFIHYFGILPLARPELIWQAYKIYANRRQPKPKPGAETSQTGDELSLGGRLASRTFKMIDQAATQLDKVLHEDLDEKSAEFVRNHPNQWVSIECLGVWDTVPALGFVPMAGLDYLIDRLPGLRHHYHDFKLQPSVRHAYHALSIDDDRKWFFPTVWKEYEPGRQTVEQVWFGGAHTDVGGGFWEAGFSDIALEWMVQKAFQHGIKLYFGSRRYWNFCVAPDATDLYHPPRTGFGRIFKAGIRDKVWDEETFKTFGPPKIHESVLERARHDPAYRPWILKNYPQADEWFQQRFEDEMLRQYIEQLRKDYDVLKVQSRESNGNAVPAFSEWLTSQPLTFEMWKTSNKSSFEDWLQQEHPFEEFEGRKILVERTRPEQTLEFELRDYDRTSLQLKLDQILKDSHAFDGLSQRGMNRRLGRSRIQYDSERWKIGKSE